ncbi:T9SS type A sorting domain-containing protein [uncultured Winogradskyella sp.]|uniref:beta strand repeat-containing protein n=1 Tax=uncultured Winogradskyella sp. TaxID=395353 RepID=UPI002604CDE0|nr:T9SS type A sorting domain-containing protein [uncultured Winogradskyella sp.]
MKNFYTLLITLLITSYGFGQEIVAISGRQSSQAATVSNISANALSRGSGINSTGTSTFNSTGWTTSTSLDTNDYIEWSVTADVGFTVTVNNVEIDYDRSSNGPTNVSIRTSLDSFTSDIFTDTSVNASGEIVNFSTSLTSTDGGTITFRLYGYDAATAGGTFDIEDDLGTVLGQSQVGVILSGTVDAASSCTAPSTQASAYNTTSIGTTSATLNWTSGDGDEVLVVVKEGSAVDTNPTNGTSYTGNTVFTSGDEIGTGNYVVQSGSATSSVSITGLTESTTYHVAIYEYNTIDTCYNLTELTGNFTTDCSTPTDVSTFTAVADNATVDLSWANGSCFDEILVIAKAGSAVTVTPTGDGTAYTADAAFASGTDLGTGEYAVYKGTGTSVMVTGLTNGTTYHFTAFARKVTTWSAGMSNSATPNLVEEAVAGDLIITEVSGDDSASGNDNGYMEIYNRSNKIINLDNIEARYFNSNPGNSTQQVTLSGTLAPGGFIIVTQNSGNYTTEYTDTADATGSSFFFNGGDDGCDVFHTTNGVIDQFNDNGSGQSPWNWNDNFSYKRNSSDSGAIQDNWTADGTNNNPRTKPNLYFWTGDSDSSWTNTGNWDEGSAPSNTTDVIITNQTNTPSISTSIAISNLTIETNGNLTVEKTGNLEASGNLNNNEDLTLESDSNEYSSLIVDGTVSGSVSYERYVNSNDAVNGNDLISAPVSGQAFDIFIGNNTNILANSGGPEVLFGGFDNDSSTDPYELWNDTDTTPLTAGVGYRSGIDEAASSNLVTFEGTVNTSLVEVAIDQGTASILNLIGNPFPSYLDAQAFLSENAILLDPSAQVIYGYNDSTDGTSAGDYTIISSLVNTDLDIAPGQGFFVASNSTGGNIQFTTSTPDMRITSTDDDFIAGRDAATAITNIKLDLSNTSDNFLTDIFFTEFSGLGLDPGYDASLLGGTAPAFALYTHLVQENMGLPFAIQALGKVDYGSITIPLGVNANQGEQLTFSITENTLPSTVNVYLDDNVANTTTLLNSSDYVLTPTTNLSNTGRFYLRFADSALSTSENNFEDINIYTNHVNRTIHIAGQLLEDTVANVYDIQGRLVTSKTLASDTTLQTINASSLGTGIYVIKLSSKNQVRAEKIILK